MRIVFYKVLLYLEPDLMQLEVFLKPNSGEIRRFARSRDNKISRFCKNIHFFLVS